jgi:3-isopropylmalate/(R)-2-methylmalate dehydratase small subunit
VTARTLEPIRVIRSRTVVLGADDVDTDQIIPARFLTTTRRDGFGEALFADWRFDAAGRARAGFALNAPEAKGARARAGARSSPARSPPRPPRSPARSPTHGS